MTAFSTPIASVQIGFLRGFRHLLLYSRTTNPLTAVQSFLLRKVENGNFKSIYCKLWVSGGNLMMDSTANNALPAGYTADQSIAFNSLDYGFFGNDAQHIVIGIGDVRYVATHGAPPQVILYGLPVTEANALIITCQKDYELTFYRNGSTRIVNDVPDDLIFNP